jgi:hypothetical protein
MVMLKEVLVINFIFIVLVAGFNANIKRSAFGFKMVSTYDDYTGKEAGKTKTLPGIVPPVGFFDPLNLSSDKSDAEIKKWREAELKHGRVAMLATLGILTAESFHPLWGFGGRIMGPAIYHFQQIENIHPAFWPLALLFIGATEGQNIIDGWEKQSQTVAMLNEDYIPGDLGFDPLNIRPIDPNLFKTMRTKELQNGRLAMLGVAGMVAQELVNNKPILVNIFGGEY